MIRGTFCAALAAIALSGCAGTSVNDVAAALKDDPASVCVHVENSYPPFQNKFTLVRMGAGGTAMGVGTDCSGVQGGAPPPTVPSATLSAAPVKVQ